MKGEDKAIIDSNDYYQRTTILTRFLRKLKLDEIPQLINILEGSINFIGPRPLPLSYIKKSCLPKKYWIFRASIKPGITGLAQLLNYDHDNHRLRMSADILYIKKKGLFFDIGVILKTFGKLLTVLFR